MIAGSLGKRVADSEGAGGLKGLQEVGLVGRKKDNGRRKSRGKEGEGSVDRLARIDWSFVKVTPPCSHETNHSVKSLGFLGVFSCIKSVFS